MTNDEFLCAELGIIDDIEAYSPDAFQREFLLFLEDGLSKYQRPKLRMLLGELADRHGMIPRDETGAAVGDETTLFSYPHFDLIIRVREARQHGRRSRELSGDKLQRILRPAFELVENHVDAYSDAYREDLARRWQSAGEACAWEGVFDTGDGRLVALTDSPIWAALGSGGLFEDGLDIDFPPFYVNGGWRFGWSTVTRRELSALGWERK